MSTWKHLPVVEFRHAETKERKKEMLSRLDVCQSQREYKACQQCIGEYYLDLKTFSSSRSSTEISVLTQMCRKGQCLQQIAANELGHSVHRFNLLLLLWLMLPFTSMTAGEGNSLIFFHNKTNVSSRHFKEKKEKAALDGKQRFETASPRRIMHPEVLFHENKFT